WSWEGRSSSSRRFVRCVLHRVCAETHACLHFRRCSQTLAHLRWDPFLESLMYDRCLCCNSHEAKDRDGRYQNHPSQKGLCWCWELLPRVLPKWNLFERQQRKGMNQNLSFCNV